MSDPLKPVPRPQQVVKQISGERHMTYGCMLFAAGLAAIGGVIYTFRDFFFNEANAVYVIVGLVLFSGVVRWIMFQFQKKH